MARKSFEVVTAYPFPLTVLIYGMTGLMFIRHRGELIQITRDLIYTGVKILASRHSEYFPKLYFTQRGNLSHSKEVEDVLFRLGGVLFEIPPYYRHIKFEESELDCVETKLSKWLSTRNKEIVEKLAEEFYQIVKTLT